MKHIHDFETFVNENKLFEYYELTDETLIQEAEEYARLADQIDKLNAEISKLKIRFDELDKKFIAMLEALEEELGGSKKTFIKAKNILIKISRRGGKGTKYKYKEAFEWLHQRVSPQMKKLIDETLEAHKNVYSIKSSLSVQYESSNWLSGLFNKLKGWFSKFISSFRKTRIQADNDLDKLDSMI